MLRADCEDLPEPQFSLSALFKKSGKLLPGCFESFGFLVLFQEHGRRSNNCFEVASQLEIGHDTIFSGPRREFKTRRKSPHNMGPVQTLALLLLASAIPLVGAQTTSYCVDTNNGATDMMSRTCVTGLYASDSTYCGNYDRASGSFVANDMCCACGGGLTASAEPSSIPSDAPTTRAPISTTCYDLKSSFQNSSCCDQDMGKAATFNGTAVACGNVLASYTSSECCDADLAKNATMIFN